MCQKYYYKYKKYYIILFLSFCHSRQKFLSINRKSDVILLYISNSTRKPRNWSFRRIQVVCVFVFVFLKKMKSSIDKFHLNIIPNIFSFSYTFGTFGYIHFLYYFLCYCHCHWFVFASFVYSSDEGQVHWAVGESIRKSWVQPLDLEHSLGEKTWPCYWEAVPSPRSTEAAVLGYTRATFSERKNILEVKLHH